MQVEQVTPILNVSDFRASVAWFGHLGWTPGFEWRATGEIDPTFGAVRSGDDEIFLCVDGQGGRGDGNGVWVSVWVDDVDAVHDACVRHHLDVVVAPRDESWDVREMQVQHPDGHVLRISRAIPHDH